jgi:DNA-binding GntR family transcriptional regulator
MPEEPALLMLAPPSRVLSDHIAEQLRQAIVTQQLKPGQRIVEREIAEAMATSRGPVRDALLQLEREGLVVRSPHRGAFVASLSLEDAEEIYSLRQAIETLAVQYALRRATPDQLDELDKYVDRMAREVQEEFDPVAATELDLAFHRAICRMSGHKRLLEAWEALSAQTRVLLLARMKREPQRYGEQVVDWHRRLVEALRRGEPARAQEELCKHLADTMQTLLASSPEQPG